MYLLKGEKKLVGKYMYLPKIEKTSRKNVCMIEKTSRKNVCTF